MYEIAVRVTNFRKQYGTFVAVDGISFEVRRGEIFGLLGPNGAGKTSTLEALEGLRRADGGTLSVMGIDPTREARKLRDIIGVQLQTSALPANMTVGEAMRFFCAYHGVPERPDLIRRMGLAEKTSAQYASLSTGQQRRLALAIAIAHNPPVVFLDEPTAGLDVATRAELHEMVRELRAAGTTIILATHDMAEAEKLCDRVAILLRGRIAAIGTPRELTATGSGLTKVSVRTESGSLTRLATALPGVRQQTVQDDGAHNDAARRAPQSGPFAPPNVRPPCISKPVAGAGDRCQPRGCRGDSDRGRPSRLWHGPVSVQLGSAERDAAGAPGDGAHCACAVHRGGPGVLAQRAPPIRRAPQRVIRTR